MQTERTPCTTATALRSGLVGPLSGVCKRGSAPPSQPEVLRSLSKSPKMCPSSSRCACSSPGLEHTLSSQTPKCPPPSLCLFLRFLCSAQAAQERTRPIHTDLQQPRALGDPVRCPPDLGTHTPTLSGQQTAGGTPLPGSPVSRAQGRHAHQARGWPSRASVARGCVANSAASPSSSGPPSSPAFWRFSAAPLPGPCWSTTPGGVRGAGQQRAPKREPHRPANAPDTRARRGRGAPLPALGEGWRALNIDFKDCPGKDCLSLAGRASGAWGRGEEPIWEKGLFSSYSPTLLGVPQAPGRFEH